MSFPLRSVDWGSSSLFSCYPLFIFQAEQAETENRMQYFLTCSLKLLWKNCKLFSANCKTRYPNLSVYGGYSHRMALTKLTRIFFLVCWRRTIQKKKSNWVSTAVMDARVLFSAESTKPRSAAKCLMWPVLSDWAFFTTTTAW